MEGRWSLGFGQLTDAALSEAEFVHAVSRQTHAWGGIGALEFDDLFIEGIGANEFASAFFVLRLDKKSGFLLRGANEIFMQTFGWLPCASCLDFWHVGRGAAFGSVTIDWVIVRDAGNTTDTNGYGAVGYELSIGTNEVTNAQYAAFLNAVAVNDANNLYNESMGSAAMGGFTRAGDPGNYVYAVKSGHENLPVVYVSVTDAMRFTIWLHNGMGSGGTETGAYDLTLGQGP